MNLAHLEHTKDEFIKTANSQERKGILKYGKPLEPMDDYDWLDMEFEELVDAVKYNRAAKRKLLTEKNEREFVIERIRTITERCDYQAKMEINHWLDVLEGTE